jgi:hypothetical protein
LSAGTIVLTILAISCIDIIIVVVVRIAIVTSLLIQMIRGVTARKVSSSGRFTGYDQYKK